MTATQLSAKTVRTSSGKMWNISLDAVKPNPILSDVATMCGGIFRRLVNPGDEVHYKQPMAEIIDPFLGNVKETILAPTEGIVFFAHKEPLVHEGDTAYRLIHRLHE